MATKLRFQNVVIGDTVRLSFDVYNSNAFADVADIDHIDIVFLDPTARTEVNPHGRTLFTTVDGTDVVHCDTGKYYIDLPLPAPQFVVGNYQDIWHVQFRGDEQFGQIEQNFSIWPDLWITSPMPIVYDFQFRFSPSRWRRGEIKHLQCEINPLVPRQSDLVRYYANLAIAADIYVSIEEHCAECVPEEADLRLIVDEDLMTYKEKGVAFYRWDTSELKCGIYDVWATMMFGDNVFKSDKQQMQVFE